MSEQYMISIDQSTQGTKALLFNSAGSLIWRVDQAHRQIIDEKGWVSHDPMEIYQNIIAVTARLLEETQIDRDKVAGVGISNQRETSLAWNRITGEPVGLAVVWQCARAADLCDQVAAAGHGEKIRRKTGMNLSPYFPASKIAWILRNVEGARELSDAGKLCHGTIDSWVIYKLTGKASYKTDFSNASRTQLFNIFDLKWDEEICGIFGIDPKNLPEVCDSNSNFGETDFDGVLPHSVPIHGVVTSLAWSIDGKVNYVLEGNLNYTGAVITWLKDDLKMIQSPEETQSLAEQAAADDPLYLVPAFSGLGAPYWDSRATAMLTGMTRTTGRAEVVRAGLECIAYQIQDVIEAMSEDSQVKVHELRVDGGPTKNAYLMQFQSDIAGIDVQVPDSDELSGMGPAFAAGMALGLWDQTVFEKLNRKKYAPRMDAELRNKKYEGWKKAVEKVLA